MSEKTNPLPEWADAVARLMPALLAWAKCQLPDWIRGKLDAADLVQQTLVEAEPQAAQFVVFPEAALLSFLRRALSNNLIDAIRKFGRSHGEVSLDVLVASSVRMVNWLAADDTSPSERAVRNDNFARLADGLAQLPDAQRIAVELRYLQGWKMIEIARELGKSEDAVAQLLRRGVAALREKLGDGKE
jgi:RNA polymerase sigma-70 factor (ECF subfamily)